MTYGNSLDENSLDEVSDLNLRDLLPTSMGVKFSTLALHRLPADFVQT